MVLLRFLIVLVFIGIAFFEVPRLIRKKLWRELWTFSVLLLVGFVLAFLQTMGITLPMPPLSQ